MRNERWSQSYYDGVAPSERSTCLAYSNMPDEIHLLWFEDLRVAWGPTLLRP